MPPPPSCLDYVSPPGWLPLCAAQLESDADGEEVESDEDSVQSDGTQLEFGQRSQQRENAYSAYQPQLGVGQ